jgi:hypothetical protein
MFGLKRLILLHPVGPVSQPIFVFQWEEPQLGGHQQLTRICLPQGFKIPQLSLKLPGICKHTQQRKLAAPYFNYLLTATNHQDSFKGTELLLHLQWETRYKVSQKKAQTCQE